jgi:hypothetical protein
MSFLFGNKQSAVAMAEVIEDGREKSNQEMKKAKYNNYEGAEPMIQIAVHVLPQSGPPFDALMKTGLTKTYLLKPGVRVQVKYDPKHPDQVTLDDDNQAILARNPQLIKKQ